jgi:hypothetical protein
MAGVAARLVASESNGLRQTLERGMARVTEARMPERGVMRGMESHQRSLHHTLLWTERVEITRRVTSEERHPGAKVLNGKTPRIKFNRD